MILKVTRSLALHIRAIVYFAPAKKLRLSAKPISYFAHGTATRANDETEDRVFSALFDRSPWITGTKWMIGHTLGASGLIDTIVAREVIRSGRAPALMTTKSIDPVFKGRYITEHAKTLPAKKVLVTSLGFGGVHGAALVGRA